MKTPPSTTHALMYKPCSECEPGTFCTIGLLGCWRPICGHFRHAPLANSQSYWLRGSSRNWLATRLAIIPSPS
jgi:hypothetical protein